MIVSSTTAHLTRYIHIWQEVHFYLGDTVSAAGLTSSALHIEAEASLLISSHLSLWHLCKEVSNRIEHSRVSRRVRSRRASDRRLVNIYNLIEVLNATYLFMRTGLFLQFVCNTCYTFVKDFIYKR